MNSNETKTDELSNILRLLQKNQREIERLKREVKSPSNGVNPNTAFKFQFVGKSLLCPHRV
ncbi:hypothetical protein ACSU64_03150 [Bacillaceae bacterium C204]|uniref:hypothetical protein n=1 Tax=Neobacillus sp. 204 TaxID=3383351 RepID=UPI00397C67EF